MTGVAEFAGRRRARVRASDAQAPPTQLVIMLIAAGFVLRLLFAAMLGLGIDESYMVASGRAFRLGYFDHPPASWWLAAGAAHLFGTETDVVVRLPFIALFALTTWLIYRLGTRLYSERAGLWAAVALNLSPVFGVTTGSWVLPDGPLICALAGAALCLVHALDGPKTSWRWWLGTGLCAGLALFSKYSAVLVIGGAFLYLLTQPGHRRWLVRPQPYAAGLIAVLVFAPVLVWNALNGFPSFAFQGERAVGGHFHPLMPFVVLAGSALFVLPWIWLPMMAEFVRGLRRGPRDARLWLQCCLGAPAILAFPLIAVWTDQRVLFHWAAPGYLMLFPALGAWIDRRLNDGSRLVCRTLIGTAALLLSVVAVIATDVRWDWIPAQWWEAAKVKRDPALQGIDWTSLRRQLDKTGLLGRPGLLVAGIGWQDCGKVDYALGGRPRLICLTDDPRQYGLDTNLASLAGRDILIIAPGNPAERVAARESSRFSSVEVLPSLTVDHAGRPVLPAALVLGHGFRPPTPAR